MNQLGPHGEVGINIVRCCSPPPGTADVVSGVSCTSHALFLHLGHTAVTIPSCVTIIRDVTVDDRYIGRDRIHSRRLSCSINSIYLQQPSLLGWGINVTPAALTICVRNRAALAVKLAKRVKRQNIGQSDASDWNELLSAGRTHNAAGEDAAVFSFCVDRRGQRGHVGRSRHALRSLLCAAHTCP